MVNIVNALVYQHWSLKILNLELCAHMDANFSNRSRLAHFTSSLRLLARSTFFLNVGARSILAGMTSL